VLISLLLASALGNPSPDGGPRLNYLVILLDDVGLDQLACYDDQNQYTGAGGPIPLDGSGGPPGADASSVGSAYAYAYAYTPNIDALAARGVRFNQCRTMPVCSPTRATLLSGRYPFRHGVGISVEPSAVSPAFVEFGLAPAPQRPILPAVLSGEGYATAAFGKWHLGLPPLYGGTLDTQPTDLGFDEWRGTPRNLESSLQPPAAGGFAPGYFNYWWVEGGVRRQLVGVYGSDQITARTVDWLATAHEPSLAYVAYSGCHAPLTGSNWPPSQHGFGNTPPPDTHRNTRYRAALENLDAQVGALVAACGPRTVVFLLGDNGTNANVFMIGANEVRYPVGHPLYDPATSKLKVSMAPYEQSKFKNSLYEGGIRVPFIAAGPAIAAPGRVSEDLVDAVDVFATIARLEGASGAVDTNAFDLTPVLRGQRGSRSWSFAEHFAPNGVGPLARHTTHTRAFLREDGPDLWKLIHFVSNDPAAPEDRFEFYRLRDAQGPADPLELVDLGPGHPAFAATREAYERLVGG